MIFQEKFSIYPSKMLSFVVLATSGCFGQVREMKVKVLVQQIMKGSENIKENMDHVWRNLEYIEETYEQMFLKTHRIQVRTRDLKKLVYQNFHN